MNRREFLGGVGALAAASALPGLLTGCDFSGGASSSSPRQPTAADWDRLAGSLNGGLIRPDDPTFAGISRVFNQRFDRARPAAVALCRSSADVQACLALVRGTELPLAVRGGGHSYAGYSVVSGGLVIDVSRLDQISTDGTATTATVGAGARLIDIYARLAKDGLALPGGSCPTVGIAGLALGGGVGVIGRKFGLTCDNLVAADVITADGRQRTCDADHDPDLFWALRGGGGGNFGVVISFKFRVHPISSLALFTYRWPWDRAATVVDAWQSWAPGAPDELWSNCVLESNAGQGLAAVVNGVYVGGAARLAPLLRPLLDQAGGPSHSSPPADVSVLKAMLDEAGCYGSLAECHLPDQDPQGKLTRQPFAARSDYFSGRLSSSAIGRLVQALEHRAADSRLGDLGVGLDAHGGAINRVPPGATAFFHRGALFSAQYSAYWHGDDAEVAGANQRWLDDTWQAMRPHATGFSYQNYIDPALTNWQTAYYGDNLARLRQIKAAYDPHQLFRFPQSIPPS